ncbi:hypothetical protein [Paenarthrobacter sp. PH39-S1]|uniref:hypothetical protein n=1 Tax=Paenarthrobacter sp. PH39-S1 TaxID=3046204 RepID=UPI0024B9A679|nr:hypothetical protein [Paenarthrobacter sp. PH39-S1]MDJ0358000.1 hypothetical protein [Paenarthrobacter sp. PH39-S1]
MSTVTGGRVRFRAGRTRHGSVPATAALLPETVRLFTGFAAFGAAALTFGLSSNLLAAALGGNPTGAPGTTTVAVPAELAGAVIVAAWGVCLLLWAIRSLRRGVAAWPVLTTRILPIAVAVQLLGIIYGLWQLPMANRSFDLSAACAFILELAMLGSLGWLHRTGKSAQDTDRGSTGAGSTGAGSTGAGSTVAGSTVAGSTGAGSTGAGSTVKGSTVKGTTAAVPAAAPPAGRLLAAMFAASLLVAAVATPGLAATTAGLHAVPHGGHGGTAPTLHDPAAHHH